MSSFYDMKIIFAKDGESIHLVAENNTDVFLLSQFMRGKKTIDPKILFGHLLDYSADDMPGYAPLQICVNAHKASACAVEWTRERK